MFLGGIRGWKGGSYLLCREERCCLSRALPRSAGVYLHTLVCVSLGENYVCHWHMSSHPVGWL